MSSCQSVARKNPYLAIAATSSSTTTTISTSSQSSLPPPSLGCTDLANAVIPKLRPFQLAAVEGALARHDSRLLLGDEMGLGKTVTSLAIMAHYTHLWKPLLIICPPSLRYQWPAEIEKFLPSIPSSSVRVIQSFADVSWTSDPTIKVLVLTYSLLRSKPSALGTALAARSFPCVICDESHHLKTHDSQKTQHTMLLLKRAKHMVLLSGTPATSRPVELYGQLTALAVSPATFGTYSQFTNKFCDAKRGRFGWDVSGCTNSRELNELLNTVMIRRLKKVRQPPAALRVRLLPPPLTFASLVQDVLHDLPAKTRKIVEIPIDKKSDAGKAAVDAIASWQLLSKSDEASFEARNSMMRAYQLGGIAKVNHCCDYIEEWLDSAGEEKVLLFAHHKEVMSILEERFRTYLARNSPSGVRKNKKRYIYIDGGVNPKERQAQVKAFQEDPHVRVAILSITAAGVGLTLTAASNAIFVELVWSPGADFQAEDRIHRIGQHYPVNINFLICDDKYASLDRTMYGMLRKKVSNVRARQSEMSARRKERRN